MPVPDPPTFEEVAALVRGCARSVGEVITPAGDWVPMLIVQDQSGHVRPPIDLAPYMGTDIAKDRLFRSLPRFIDEVQALRVALIIGGWTANWLGNADGSPLDAADRVRPREDPNRVEILSVLVAEAGRLEAWDAPVSRRSGVQPLLGEWRQPEGDLEGALPDALRKAFA